MTFNELRKLVVSIWKEEVPELEFDNWDDDDEEYIGQYQFKEFLRGYSYKIPENARVLYIEHEGGGEGGGEACESVIKVDDTFYAVNYAYASYEGFYWDDAEVSVVQPVERVVTFYEAI